MPETPYYQAKVSVSIGDHKFSTKYWINGFRSLRQILSGKKIDELMKEPGSIKYGYTCTLQMYKDHLFLSLPSGNLEIKYSDIISIEYSMQFLQIKHSMPIKKYIFIRDRFGGHILYSRMMDNVRKYGLPLNLEVLSKNQDKKYYIWMTLGSIFGLLIFALGLYVIFGPGF